MIVLRRLILGFVTSMYLSILNPLFRLCRASLIGLNMAAYATTMAYTGLLNITDDIKEFILEHQTYILEDVFHGILDIATVAGVTAVMGPLGFISVIVAEGDLILRIRTHYLPQEYWKYISIHRSWAYGYELRSYVGEDHCIHYIEIPKNPDGSLRWEDAAYI
ncbi:MAG: hypothetical protein ACPLF9_08275 [Methanothermobacter tenebrarum]